MPYQDSYVGGTTWKNETPKKIVTTGPSGYTSLDAIANEVVKSSPSKTFSYGGKSYDNVIDYHDAIFGKDDNNSSSSSSKNDYLAKILQETKNDGVVPPPSQPDIPQSFREFNAATNNMFRAAYNPQTGEYELADNPPSQFTNNRNDITAGIVKYVPPNMRDFLMIGGQYDRSLPHAIVDNVIGLDDEVVSAGEAFGQQAYDDPLGTLKGMGLGAAEGMYNLLTSPIDTVSGYLDDVKTAAMRDQTDRTADERLADIATVASIFPAAKVTQGLGSMATAPAKNQAEPFKKLDAQSFAEMEARGTQDLRNLGERLLGSDPRYAGIGSPLFDPNQQMGPATILNARSKKVSEAKKMFEQGASQKEVAEKTGIQRIMYEDYLGDKHTQYFMQLPKFEVDMKKINEMKKSTTGAGFKSTIGEIIPQVNADIDYLTASYNQPKLLSEVPVIMDALNDAIAKDDAVGAYYSNKNNEKIVLDPKQIASAIASTLSHEVEHAVQARGNPNIFKGGSGGPKGAQKVIDLMLGSEKKNPDGSITTDPGVIANEVSKVNKLILNGKKSDGTPLSDAQKESILKYGEALIKTHDFFSENRPFELYQKSPAEVLARGAEPNEQLTVKQYDLPRSAPFNPYFPMTTFERLENIKNLIKDKDYKPSRNRQMSYEQMSPYAFDFLSGYRPDQLLGPKK